MKRLAATVLGAALAFTLSACSDDGDSGSESSGSVSTRPKGPTSTTSEPSVTSAAAPVPKLSMPPVVGLTPQAQPAVDAYAAFWQKAEAAYASPVEKDAKYPPAADFAQHAFPPFSSSVRGFLNDLSDDGLSLRGPTGSSGTPRLAMKSVDLAASPPKVVLLNCPTKDVRKLVDVDTGKVSEKQQPVGSVPTPYLLTVTVVQKDGRWGVQATTPDATKTCTAPK